MHKYVERLRRAVDFTCFRTLVFDTPGYYRNIYLANISTLQLIHL